MAFTPIHLLNLTELKSRRGNSTDTTLATIIGLNYPPDEAFAIYIWNNLSTETADDNEIVQPTIGGITTGRWYRVDLGITSALVIAALGYEPYNNTNPDGYISNFTESDPIWSAVASTYRTKIQNDALYEAIFSKNTAFNKNFGTSAGTVTEGNDSRVLNGQTAFGWGNHALAGYLTSVSFAALIGKPTTLSGYGITDAYPLTGNPSSFINQAGARTAISLTTTGTGAASYSNINGVLNIPTPPVNTDYVNTATVAGGAGNSVFYLTSDKTSTGTALYTTVTYVNPIVNDSNVNYSYSWSYNAGTKALTVNTKAAVGLNVALVGLTLLGVPSNVANGTSVQVFVKGN